MTARQQAAMAVFVGKGYAPTGAAAITGGITGESGVDLNSTVNRVNADHGSGGAAEWRLSRKTNMIAFVRAMGKPETDLESQCLFIINELEQDYASLNAELRAGVKPIAVMCYNFVNVYERPNMSVAHMDDIRVPQAIAVYNTYNATAHRTLSPAAKGAVVIGTAAGGGAIVGGATGASPTLTIAMAIISGISYLISALSVQKRPKVIPSESAALPPITPISQLPVSALDNFKAKLEKLRAAQIEVDVARKTLVDYSTEVSAVLASVDIKTIEHEPTKFSESITMKLGDNAPAVPSIIEGSKP